MTAKEDFIKSLEDGCGFNDPHPDNVEFPKDIIIQTTVSKRNIRLYGLVNIIRNRYGVVPKPREWAEFSGVSLSTAKRDLRIAREHWLDLLAKEANIKVTETRTVPV